VLTGVAIEEHIVLTAGHTFLYEPEDGHPLRVDQHLVKYEILADGWRGLRDRVAPDGKHLIDFSLISRDYLLLRTDIAFPHHAQVKPLEFERIKEVRRATLITREDESTEPIAIPISQVFASENGDCLFIELRSSGTLDKDRLRLSGSPLIGEYKDGTLVLLGTVSSSGDLFFGDPAGMEIREAQVLITPAHRVPWDVLTK
jgi:hypothetical protein